MVVYQIANKVHVPSYIDSYGSNNMQTVPTLALITYVAT